MQHNSFLPELGIADPNEFWSKAKALARTNDMDEILAYMHLMLKEADYKNMSMKRSEFIRHGNGIKFFDGVEEWFARINKYGTAKKIMVEHYIISSGLREMIEGTSIRPFIKHVFASGFMYNRDDVAVWPATAVNYTNKTQHLFRINKGVENSWNNKAVNEFVAEGDRAVPFPNMVYIGDGETDIPAMKMTMYYGGTAIAVYNPEKPETKTASDLLVPQNRANHSFAADYSEGSEIDLLIKARINQLA